MDSSKPERLSRRMSRTRRRRLLTTLGVVTVAGLASAALMSGVGRNVAGAPLRSPAALGVTARPEVTPVSQRGTMAAGPVTAAPLPSRWVLVGLGDSVPAGSACNCTSYVNLLGSRITRDTGIPVSVQNLAVPGATSGDLLASLAEGRRSAGAVAGADIVTITIGANDFVYGTFTGGQCGIQDVGACYASEVATMRSNVQAIVQRIEALRAGRPTAILVTDYWDIWKDGQVGRQYGTEYMRVGDLLTQQVNQAIEQAADAGHATFVDLFEPFRGVSGTEDDTPLLASDGDHPSESGHQVIANVLAEMGLAPLVPAQP